MGGRNDARCPHARGGEPRRIFFGYAYYRANSATLRTLPVDGVEPRPETVDLGAYPLVRPLFIYTARETLNMKPQTAAFLNFYLRQVKHYIVDVGYFMPDEEAYQEAIRCFNQAIQ
jgi:phosphate transport system substrate-binding protein